MPRHTGACRSCQTLALGMNPASSAPLGRLRRRRSMRATQVVVSRQELLSFFAEVFKSHARPAFLLHPHAQPTSSRLATSPSRVAQALHPSGSRTSATATQGSKVRRWLALRAAVLRRAVRDTRRCAARPRGRNRSAFERCVRLAVSVRSQPMQEARAQFHSPSVLVQRRSRPSK